MRIALIADLHGNWPAVEALENDLNRRSVDMICCLGDLVGKGPLSDRTMDWALQNCQVIIRGNWDEGVGQRQFPADQFYYDQLGAKRLDTLASLPLEHHLTLSGRRIRLIHGRPIMDRPYSVNDDAQVFEPLFDPDWDVVGYGDVHRQGMRIIGCRGILFNTGSVGNGLGLPMVQYTLLEGGKNQTDPFDIHFVSLPYDRDRAIRLTLEAQSRGLNHADEFISEIKNGIYARKSGSRDS